MRLVVAFLLSVIVYGVVALAGLWTIAEVYALPPGPKRHRPGHGARGATRLRADPRQTSRIMGVWAVSAPAACPPAARRPGGGGGARHGLGRRSLALAGDVWMLTRTTQPIWMTITTAVVIPSWSSRPWWPQALFPRREQV